MEESLRQLQGEAIEQGTKFKQLVADLAAASFRLTLTEVYLGFTTENVVPVFVQVAGDIEKAIQGLAVLDFPLMESDVPTGTPTNAGTADLEKMGPFETRPLNPDREPETLS